MTAILLDHPEDMTDCDVFDSSKIEVSDSARGLCIRVSGNRKFLSVIV